MKIFRSIQYLIILSACIIGCSDKEPEKKTVFPEYLIFGHFYGICVGEQCIEIFKIQNDSLFEAEDIYPWLDEDDLYDAVFHFIGNEKLPTIIDITQNIPNSLLEINTHIIGCPDCADQGGYFIEFSTTDFHNNWSIDKNRFAVPENLHDFLDLVDQKIQILNE